MNKARHESDLARLATSLRQLDDSLAGCMKCGLCQAVCPVFGVTKLESDVARGKLALLDGLAQSLLEGDEAVRRVDDRLNRCLLCGSCEAQCPSGVPLTDIFMQARVLLTEYRGLSPVKKAVFRGLLARPGLFDALARLGRHGQKLVFRPAGAAGQTVSAPLLAPLLGTKRHIAPLAAPLHLAGGADLPARDGMPTVAFFPGCLGDKMFPDMSKACLKALTWHGVGVWLPPGLACCGIPALASGDARGFARMAARNLEILATRAFDALVTPCATCTTTIARLWPRHLGGAKLSPAAARLLAELPVRAQDIHAFLVRTCGAPAHLSAASPTDAPRLVAYHDSCHLKKGLGVTTEPRALIAANPAYRLVEMERADACCGHGGSFNLFRYDLSSRIGRAKRDAVVASGADTVAAGCPACMLQLMDMLAKNGDTIRVRHSLEIYAEALPDASDGQSGSGDSGPGRG